MKRIPYFFKVVPVILIIGFPLFVLSLWEEGQIPADHDAKSCL